MFRYLFCRVTLELPQIKLSLESRLISDFSCFFWKTYFQVPKCFWKAAHGMQSRNGDTAGDEPWPRLRHWQHPLFPASQRVPGERTAGQRELLCPAVFVFCELFILWTWPYCVLTFWWESEWPPLLIQNLVFNRLPVWPWHLSSPNLFSVTSGSLAVSDVRRNPAPPDFSKGSLEIYTFCTSASEQWNLLRLRKMDVSCVPAYLYTWVYSEYFSLFLNYKHSQ